MAGKPMPQGCHAYMHAGVASVAVDMSSHVFTCSIPLIGMLVTNVGVTWP